MLTPQPDSLSAGDLYQSAWKLSGVADTGTTVPVAPTHPPAPAPSPAHAPAAAPAAPSDPAAPAAHRIPPRPARAGAARPSRRRARRAAATAAVPSTGAAHQTSRQSARRRARRHRLRCAAPHARRGGRRARRADRRADRTEGRRRRDGIDDLRRRIPTLEACIECAGHGTANAKPAPKCPTCAGGGQVRVGGAGRDAAAFRHALEQFQVGQVEAHESPQPSSNPKAGAVYSTFRGSGTGGILRPWKTI